MSDYHNLLVDTLRSGHLQVEKIYHRLLSIYSDEDRCVNIRTGYPMKMRDYDTNYVYPSDWRFKICYHFDRVGREFDVRVYERLLKKYEDWLADYEKNSDNERIKNLIRVEVETAKSEPDHNRTFMRENADQLDYILDDIEDPEEGSVLSDDFIQNDNEVTLANERKVKFFNFSLGRKKKKRTLKDELKRELEDILPSQGEGDIKLPRKRLRKMIESQNQENDLDYCGTEQLFNENFKSSKKSKVINDEDEINENEASHRSNGENSETDNVFTQLEEFRSNLNKNRKNLVCYDPDDLSNSAGAESLYDFKPKNYRKAPAFRRGQRQLILDDFIDYGVSIVNTPKNKRSPRKYIHFLNN
jgi:hypothetical protein